MKKPAAKTKTRNKDPLSVKDLPAKGRTTAKVKGGITASAICAGGGSLNLPGISTAETVSCAGGGSLNLRGVTNTYTANCTGGLTRSY